MSDTLKLYKVNTIALSEKYSSFYIIALNSSSAYQLVRKYLNDNDLCYRPDREMKSVELLAEATQYPNCKKILLLEEQP